MTRILIVEDNPLLRENLCELLQYKGFFTQEASNGQEALEILKREETDLIISDYNMPVMNGIRLLKEIKSSERNAHIPFIMMTANTDYELNKKACNLGAEAFFNKPFPLSKLDTFLVEEAMAS